MPSKRYRLKVATWIVVREAGEPSPRKITSPNDAARLALEFMRAADDDREHFWVVHPQHQASVSDAYRGLSRDGESLTGRSP